MSASDLPEERMQRLLSDIAMLLPATMLVEIGCMAQEITRRRKADDKICKELPAIKRYIGVPYFDVTQACPVEELKRLLAAVRWAMG